MSKAMKILAVMVIAMFIFNQAAYANSFSDFFSKSVYRDTLKNKIGSAKWWTSSAWSHKVQNWGTKSVYRDTLKNKIGSAHWWTSSAWSKQAQKFGCATGSWVNRNKKVIAAAGSMGVGLPLLAVGFLTLNPVVLGGSFVLLSGGSIGMMFAVPKNNANK